MNQDKSTPENRLHVIECSLGLVSSRMVEGRRQPAQGSYNLGVILDELMINVGKAQEMLELLSGRGNLPLHHSLHL